MEKEGGEGRGGREEYRARVDGKIYLRVYIEEYQKERSDVFHEYIFSEGLIFLRHAQKFIVKAAWTFPFIPRAPSRRFILFLRRSLESEKLKR